MLHHPLVERWRPRLRFYAYTFYPDAPYSDLALDEFTDRPVWCEDYMLAICWWESRGKPRAHSTKVYDDPWRQASGLYQHMPRYWDYRVGMTIGDLVDADVYPKWTTHKHAYQPLPIRGRWTGRLKPVGIFHPIANIAVAAWLWGEQGYQAWSVTHQTGPNGVTPSEWGPEWRFDFQTLRYVR